MKKQKNKTKTKQKDSTPLKKKIKQRSVLTKENH